MVRISTNIFEGPSTHEALHSHLVAKSLAHPSTVFAAVSDFGQARVAQWAKRSDLTATDVDIFAGFNGTGLFKNGKQIDLTPAQKLRKANAAFSADR